MHTKLNTQAQESNNPARMWLVPDAATAQPHHPTALDVGHERRIGAMPKGAWELQEPRAQAGGRIFFRCIQPCVDGQRQPKKPFKAMGLHAHGQSMQTVKAPAF